MPSYQGEGIVERVGIRRTDGEDLRVQPGAAWQGISLTRWTMGSAGLKGATPSHPSPKVARVAARDISLSRLENGRYGLLHQPLLGLVPRPTLINEQPPGPVAEVEPQDVSGLPHRETFLESQQLLEPGGGLPQRGDI